MPTGRRRTLGWGRGRATGEAFRVGVRGQLSPTIALIFTSTLRRIRDTGNALYHRVTAEGYKESQDDIQAVSGIAEDIRDALLDHQVCNNELYANRVQLKLGQFDRWHNNRQYTTRAAG